jgi:hypothetical protein
VYNAPFAYSASAINPSAIDGVTRDLQLQRERCTGYLPTAPHTPRGQLPSPTEKKSS